MNTLTLNLSGSEWTRTYSASNITLALTGQAYPRPAPSNAKALTVHVSAADTTQQLTSPLTRLNGFYAWVEQSPGRIRGAVDQIRSRPLFYGTSNGRFYLSNDAEWVRKEVGDQGMDPLACEEFQLSVYVLGPDTLFPNVKQLQANECLIARETDAGPVVETHRYYR